MSTRDNNIIPVSDEDLFKQPPQNEECPICCLPLPSVQLGKTYKSCCGKVLCNGCIYAVSSSSSDVYPLCPFCRTPTATSNEEFNDRLKKHAKVDDENAIFQLGNYYNSGSDGFLQDHEKAFELWHRAGELGLAQGNYNIGFSYLNGSGVERNDKKAKHYWELAAIGVHVNARYNLSSLEMRTGNTDRALKHYMIVVRGGHNESLRKIREFCMDGHATKDDYATALRYHQEYLGEVKSIHRDEAAAFSDRNRYLLFDH